VRRLPKVEGNPLMAYPFRRDLAHHTPSQPVALRNSYLSEIAEHLGPLIGSLYL
jgi:hypothetical protein